MPASVCPWLLLSDNENILTWPGRFVNRKFGKFDTVFFTKLPRDDGKEESCAAGRGEGAGGDSLCPPSAKRQTGCRREREFQTGASQLSVDLPRKTDIMGLGAQGDSPALCGCAVERHLRCVAAPWKDSGAVRLAGESLLQAGDRRSAHSFLMFSKSGISLAR